MLAVSAFVAFGTGRGDSARLRVVREAFGETFDLDPGYLNTASIGVPTSTALDRVAEVVTRWGRGETSAPEFDDQVTASRRAFAGLIGVRPDNVASGTTVGGLVGLVAANVPDRSEVAVVEGEYTSVVFPFAAQSDRGIRVTELEPARLLERAREFDVVAVSVVQSADGTVLDPDALRRMTAGGRTRVLLDVTQAVGWMPLELEWADWVVGSGYKWLLAPRGSAWLAVHPGAAQNMRAIGANWYAGMNPWQSIYGLPLRLADDARRFDSSPTWFSHVGAASSMSWLASLDLRAVRAHCMDLARRLCAALGMESPESPIVSVPIAGAEKALRSAGVRFASRAGKARLAFHLYNTVEDVDLALAALRTAKTSG